MNNAPMGSRGLHRRIEPYQGKIRGRICAIRVPRPPERHTAGSDAGIEDRPGDQRSRPYAAATVARTLHSAPPSPGHGRSPPLSAEVGLLPHWTKEPTRTQRPINARSETAAQSGRVPRATARCHSDAALSQSGRSSRAPRSLTRSLDRTGSRWRSPTCGRASAGPTKR